ncbi:tetratricopeptide repeat protein [Streptomyces sp. NPDC101151]|uniref:tetratricopeptide repeat protein n=1 Tax=Streptomyces sp. NPDC101151 TaxID=3366115 RepID=UPI00382F2616
MDDDEGQSQDGTAETRVDSGDLVDFRHATFYGPVAGKIQHDHHAAPRPAATWPHRVGSIPPQASCFQDRAHTACLSTALATDSTAVVTVPNLAGVVVGLGGVGKTQLVAHYARTVWQAGDLDILVWVPATSRSDVVTGYAAAAAALLGDTAPNDPGQAAAAFLAWLEPMSAQRACRWMVVLDDVTDPVHLNGLWPPVSPTGRTLVTTRRQDAALTTGRCRIDVGVFTPDEALAYLTAALPHPELPEQLAGLADDLGHLPLALSQAAAYLADICITTADYRQLLADRSGQLHDAAPDALPDGQRLTVAATWSLSIEHADRLRPVGLARPLLSLASFLSANGIPETVLTSSPARTYLAHHRTPDASGGLAPEASEPVSGRDVRLSLTALRRLSLIQHNPTNSGTAVRVHQLVQRAVRDTLTADHYYRTARTAADALLSAWPEIEDNTTPTEVLRANTAALTSCAEEALYRPDTHEVLYRLGHSLGEAGHVTAAHAHFRYLTDATTARLGPDHPDTLRARGCRANSLGDTGDTARAAVAFFELLVDQIRVLGRGHPRNITARNNLATLLGDSGQAAAAAAVLVDLLPDTERTLGKDHPYTLATRGNLASWQGRAGIATPEATAASYATILDEEIRVLGENHPQTLTTRQNLARWCGRSGQAAKAAATYADLLTDYIRVLGEDHPHTLAVRGNLAGWQGRAGIATPEATAASYATILDDEIRVLGENHPQTLTARNNLAHWLGEAGDAAGAARALTELLPHMTDLLSANHPDVLTTRNNLAQWRGRAGDPAAAAEILVDVLHDRSRLLGKEHPDTLFTRSALAYWRTEAQSNTAGVNE